MSDDRKPSVFELCYGVSREVAEAFITAQHEGRRARREAECEAALEQPLPTRQGDRPIIYTTAPCGCICTERQKRMVVVEPCELLRDYHDKIMALWKGGDEYGRAYGERAWSRHVREATDAARGRRAVVFRAGG